MYCDFLFGTYKNIKLEALNWQPYDAKIIAAFALGLISSDCLCTQKCHQCFEQNSPCVSALLTPSYIAALEMTEIIIDTQSRDEIVMPSYTFVSRANVFVLRGAKIVFVDIRPDTMNIDETKIEAAITNKTKAIVPVHYAGVACEMNSIMDIAQRHNLYVIEDAAQGMMSSYKGKALGTIGHLGAFSFHETKNYTSGDEGGLLLINDAKFKERAEIIREKDTNRSQFFRGMVDKYGWVDIGSSYLLNDISAAYLCGQMEKADDINKNRLATWNTYYQDLKPLAEAGHIELPQVPDHCQHNAHMFYLKLRNIETRSALIEHLKAQGVMAVFHYIPLHSSKAGKDVGVLVGDDQYTTQDSERLLRLPIFYGLEKAQANKVVTAVKNFFL